MPGLLAAGEVACTGVQGANRLASNLLLEGLVFGRRAVEGFLGDSSASPSAPALPPRTGNHLASSAAGAAAHATTALSGPPELPEGWDETIAWELDPVPGLEPVEPFSREALRRLMTAKAGVLRNGVLLREAGDALEAWAAVVRPGSVPGSEDPRAHEDANLLLAAQLLVRAAQERRESLGAHYRSDSRVSGAGTEGTCTAEREEPYRTRPKVSLVRD